MNKHFSTIALLTWVLLSAMAEPAEAQSLEGQECGPLTAFGACDGSILRYCQDGFVVEVDCAVAFGEKLTGVACGLVDEDWGYDCLAGDGHCSTDDRVTRLPCPLDAEGTPQACVGGEERFGCAPVSTAAAWPCDSTALPACDGELRLDYCGVADQAFGVHCSYFQQTCVLDECVDEPFVGSCENAPNGVHLATNEDVANFAAQECDAIAGDLRIEGAAITSLLGLEGLTTVGGSLIVLNTGALESLEGLHSVVSVGRELVIQGNTQLRDLRGLRSLEVVHSNVAIGFNDSLTSTAGLDALSPVDATLSIHDNGGLLEVDGLGGMTSLLDLSIRSNPQLRSVTGLAMLMSIDRGFNVLDNPELTALSGFTHLESLGGSLIVSNNDALTEVMSIAGIASIGGSITFAGNASMNYWPLEYLQSLAGGLSALDNPNLPACMVDEAAQRLRDGGWTGALANEGNDTSAVCP